MFIVHLRDGRTLKESDGVNWKDVPVHNITSLQLFRKGRTYTVSVDGKNVQLLQLKREITGTGPLPTGVCERVVGFIVGDFAVKMEVCEHTGNVRVTLEQKQGKKWVRL